MSSSWNNAQRIFYPYLKNVLFLHLSAIFSLLFWTKHLPLVFNEGQKSDKTVLEAENMPGHHGSIMFVNIYLSPLMCSRRVFCRKRTSSRPYSPNRKDDNWDRDQWCYKSLVGTSCCIYDSAPQNLSWAEKWIHRSWRHFGILLGLVAGAWFSPKEQSF